MATHSLPYRPDIDCLRAVAVLAVIAFHWQLGLPGGYVGIDVLFVASGFLIARSIADETERGAFSFADFYARRIRRALPGVYALVAALLCVSWFTLLPSDYANLAEEALAATSFVSNVLFWKESGYFERIAIERPLLHTWALSVLVQFYIVFPLTLTLLLRGADRTAAILRARRILLAAAVASFAVNAYQALDAPKAAFFLTHGRAWEFIVGALLALGIAAPPRSRRLGVAASLTAVAMLAVAVVSFRASTPYPGVNALFPCLAAALLIWGRGAELLPAAPLGVGAAAGRLSQSLYLWHWPVYVYAKLWYGEAAALQPMNKTFALVFVVLAAFLAHRLIELPIRAGALTPSRRAAFAGAAAAAVLLAAPSAAGVTSNGFPHRFPAEVLRIAAYSNYDFRAPYRSGTCFLSAEQSPANYDAAHCWPTKAANEKLVLLWGDSHAAHYAPGLEQLFAGTPFRLAQATLSACPPIFDWTVEALPQCRAFNDQVRELVRTQKPDFIVLAADWAALLKNESDLIVSLQRTISELAPRVPVGLIGPSPAFSERLPILLTRSYLSAGRIDPREQMEPGLDRAETTLRRVFEPWGPYFSILHEACAGDCPLFPDGAPLIWDQTHLTAAGSTAIIARLPSLRRWLCRGAPETNALCRAAGA